MMPCSRRDLHPCRARHQGRCREADADGLARDARLLAAVEPERRQPHRARRIRVGQRKLQRRLAGHRLELTSLGVGRRLASVEAENRHARHALGPHAGRFDALKPQRHHPVADLLDHHQRRRARHRRGPRSVILSARRFSLVIRGLCLNDVHERTRRFAQRALRVVLRDDSWRRARQRILQGLVSRDEPLADRLVLAGLLSNKSIVSRRDVMF